MGRLVNSNLMNLGLLEEADRCLKAHGRSVADFEQIEDDALGNGGLGRLAACFLDSAATHGIPLDGYGIRYRYGLFRQYFEDGFQRERADDWLRFGDPWSVRREEDAVEVRFADQTVRAVPYDMPVIGYGGKTINTLRLWQSEPLLRLRFRPLQPPGVRPRGPPKRTVPRRSPTSSTPTTTPTRASACA